MPEFHIRVREPGLSAVFTIQASWGDGTPTADVRKLWTEAYAAGMERIENAITAVSHA